MIDVKDICFSYGSHRILSQVSLSIGNGECVGLCGPSGCGKSTLAKIIAGHLAPSRGRILVDGVDVTGRPGRKVMLVHQESDLFPWLSVSRQIRFAMVQRNATRVSDLIRAVHLDGFESHYPSQLSGGMQKRLALVRALAANPTLLILDETFSSLDLKLKRELFAELKGLWNAERCAILLITHDVNDIEEMADRTFRLA